jgi:hypothetical protein
LVAHFSANRMRVRREPDFSALPAFAASKAAPTHPRNRPAAVNPAVHGRKMPPSPASTSAPTARQKKVEELAARLRAKGNRPKTRESLLHHINTVFGQKLPAGEAETILNDFLAQGVFTIPDGKKLAYST